MFADDIFDDEDDKPESTPEELAQAQSRKARASQDFVAVKDAVEGRNLAEADLIELLSKNETFVRMFLAPLDDELEKMATLVLNCDMVTRPEELKGYVIAFQKLLKFRRSLKLHREHGEKVLQRAVATLLSK